MQSSGRQERLNHRFSTSFIVFWFTTDCLIIILVAQYIRQKIQINNNNNNKNTCLHIFLRKAFNNSQLKKKTVLLFSNLKHDCQKLVKV